MCLGAAPHEASRAMSEELAAVLLARQQADRALGLAEGRHGRVLVTVQGDGVITHAGAGEASGSSRALGSSHAQLLAPVQQLDSSSYVAAVQPQGSAHGVLLTAPIATQQPKALLDAEQQLPLPGKLHSLHVLQAAQAGSAAVAAVVLADGTVAAADFQELCIHPAAASVAATASPGHSQRSSTHRTLSAACSGQLLAFAHQQQQQQQSPAVSVDVYSASSTSSNGDDADATASQPQQPGLQLVHSCSIPPPSPGSKLVGVSVSGALLVVLWSCRSISLCPSRQPGPVTNLQLPNALASALPPADGAAATTPVAERSASKRKQRPAADAAPGGPGWTAAALSEQHVLLVAVHSEGGSTRVQYALLDSSYGSCLSSGAFTAGSGSIAGRLALLPLAQHPFAPVALLVSGSVWLLPLQLPKADLAGLVANLGLGSQQAHAAAAAAAAGSDGAHQLLLTSRQQLNLAAIAAAVSSSSSPAAGQQQQSGPSVLQQLQQLQPPLDSTAAAKALAAAVQQVQRVLDKQKRPAQELSTAVTQLCKALEQQQQQRLAAAGVTVSQQLLAQVVSALSEARDWALLERLHALSPLLSLAACPDVLPALVAAEQYSSMRSVLLAAQDVPAEAVVRAVQHLLLQQQQQQDDTAAAAAAPSAALQAAAGEVRAAAELVVQRAEAAAAAGDPAATAQLLQAARAAAVTVDGFTSRELLLHVLLSVTVDGVEAQAGLRALPAAAVLRLLRYMVKWLHKYSRNSMPAGGAAAADPLLRAPSAAQVVEWCRLLLDAQLTKLMLLPVAGPLLQQLQKLLKGEVAATSKLASLKGVTDTWATGAPLPAAAVAANSQYVLELLDLRVRPLTAAAAGAGGAGAGGGSGPGQGRATPEATAGPGTAARPATAAATGPGGGV